MPTIAAMAFKYSIGQPFVYPRTISACRNFLRMCFAVPAEDYKSIRCWPALDRIFILHADHEQNASTSTVRLAGSSGANPFACIAAGIACLWGPSHGGANEAALKMLAKSAPSTAFPNSSRREGQEQRIPPDGLRPPRLQELRSARQGHAEDLPRGAGELGTQRRSAAEGRDGAGEDRAQRLYFIDRKLYPNVDFYSGITLKAMGFPTSMFTVLFAVARTVGWIASGRK
jgi:citrate synthase